MKYLIQAFIIVAGLLLVYLVVRQTFLSHPATPVKNGLMFWSEFAVRCMTLFFWMLVIMSSSYLIMTPRIGFIGEKAIKCVSYTFFVLHCIRLVLLFRYGAAERPVWADITGIIMAAGFAGLALWVVFTARAPAPHGEINLASPLTGSWFAMHGGGNRFINYHRKVREQAWAADFVKLGPDGFAYTGKKQEPADYHAFGEPVLAPVSGDIIDLVNDLPDNAPGERDRENPAGNFVKIRDENGAIILLAHFMEGSILVENGDHVSQGEMLGKGGNSGNSTEPHLHIQANLESGEPLALRINGEIVVRGYK